MDAGVACKQNYVLVCSSLQHAVSVNCSHFVICDIYSGRNMTGSVSLLQAVPFAMTWSPILAPLALQSSSVDAVGLW